jgi:hypothetical protein
MDGRPAEVFADTVKGGDIQAVLADACVLISVGSPKYVAKRDSWSARSAPMER